MWFHKLRRRKRRGGDPGAVNRPPVAPAPSPSSPSPNRASYYVPTRDRRATWKGREDGNPKLRDTRFPPTDIVFDVVTARRDVDRFKAMPELKLRPIVTRPPPNAASPDGSAAASPTSRVRRRLRFHATAAEEDDKASSCGQRSSFRWSWQSSFRVLVKDSADPEEDFLESMAEMIAANGVSSPRGLEELLACYLALNAPDHHRAIVAAFRRAWLHRPPPSSKGPRCTHESRFIT